MTTPTEIEALEEDFKAINECGPAWPALDGLLKSMKVYLELLKGEHPDLAIVSKATNGGVKIPVSKDFAMDKSTEDKIKEVVYDCCHSLAQPSMQGMKWGEIKDFLTRHIIDQLPQWQPIETAPRDRHILLGVQDGPFFVTMGDGKYWGMDIQKYKIFCISGKMELPKLQPTHWAEPLPLPPEETP